MKTIVKTMLIFCMMAGATPLFAYKTKWKDKKNKDAESVFKLDGVIFSGFEFKDYDTAGEPDATGASKQSAGFRVDRAYVNVRGKATGGNFKGFGFRITSDIAPAGKQGDGCSTSRCSQSNDYNIYIKYALVQIPTPLKGLRFILGQQHVPGVDGKGGHSLQSAWGHRYIEKASTEFLGMSSSADRGLGLVYYNKDMPYFGLHLLFANGEGYHHNNGEGVETNLTNLKDLARGKNADRSYGYDLYAMPTLLPTGKSKQFKVALAFPVRLQNVWGMEPEKESRTVLVDGLDGTGTSPQSLVIYQGDPKAKRDYSYGAELDLEYKSGDWTIGFGIGRLAKVDRRTNAYKYDSTSTTSLTTVSGFTSTVYLDRDQRGLGSYAFLHLRYGAYGIFGRYSIATSNSSLSSKMGTASSKGWAEQLLEADASDGILGNLKYLEAVNAYDNGRARTRSYQAGVSWILSPRFRVSLGMSDLWGDKPKGGKSFKSNPLSRVSNAGGTTAKAQLESNAQLQAALGQSNIDLDDFTGREAHEKQVWIRSELTY